MLQDISPFYKTYNYCQHTFFVFTVYNYLLTESNRNSKFHYSYFSAIVTRWLGFYFWSDGTCTSVLSCQKPERWIFVIVLISRIHLLERIILGGVGAVLATAIYFWTWHWWYKNRARKVFKEMSDTPEPIKVRVEVTESCINWKQMGVSTSHDWKNIDTIEERGDSIDFFLRKGRGIIVVRKRAFASEDHKNQFLTLSRQYLKASRQQSAE